MTDLTPERLAEMRARHRDSCPMGNNRHGTPERPDWGTFCMDCKESWPCEASTLLDALAASEKNTEAEHVWGESWKATAEAEKAAREEAERAVAAEAAEYELMVAQRNEQEARADKAERDLDIVRHAINEAEHRAAVAEQERDDYKRIGLNSAKERNAAEAQVAALRDGITQLAARLGPRLGVGDYLPRDDAEDELLALLARVDAPKQGNEVAGLEHRYEVRKVNDPSGKHDGCRFFVLDPHHDPIAVAALARYAQAARGSGYTALADDLDAWVARVEAPKPDVCECPPCPGRGNDGHGLTHCAECCFGSGVKADPDCPTHGAPKLAACDGSLPCDQDGCFRHLPEFDDEKEN